MPEQAYINITLNSEAAFEDRMTYLKEIRHPELTWPARQMAGFRVSCSEEMLKDTKHRSALQNSKNHVPYTP